MYLHYSFCMMIDLTNLESYQYCMVCTMPDQIDLENFLAYMKRRLLKQYFRLMDLHYPLDSFCTNSAPKGPEKFPGYMFYNWIGLFDPGMNLWHIACSWTVPANLEMYLFHILCRRIAPVDLETDPLRTQYSH